MGGFHEGGTSKWIRFIMENPIKVVDLEVTLFQETPKLYNKLHMTNWLGAGNNPQHGTESLNGAHCRRLEMLAFNACFGRIWR